MKKYVTFIFLASLFVSVLTSCSDTKKYTYFNELGDAQILYKAQSLEPVIQKNDLLNIVVSSLNGEANQIFNLYSVSTSVGTVNSGTVIQTSGYLVDQEGFIQFPMIGAVKAAGLSKKQLTDFISQNLVTRNVLIDPVVSIRYLNYKVTVLGEVGRPSVINVPSEKITLPEALGLAGDLTILAERSNVLLIREEAEGKRISHHINLNSSELLSSPFYYLQSNDVVYVAPNRGNAATASATRMWLPAIFSGLSLIVIILGKI